MVITFLGGRWSDGWVSFYRSTKRSFKMRYCHRTRDGRADERTNKKWATGPWVGTEVRPNTLLNFTGNCVSSYFLSAAIRHFVNCDILNFDPFLPNGQIKIHEILYVGHTRCPTHYVIAVLNGLTEFHQIWYARSTYRLLPLDSRRHHCVASFVERFTARLGGELL